MSIEKLKKIVAEAFVHCFNHEMMREEELHQYRGAVNDINKLLSIPADSLSLFSIRIDYLQRIYKQVDAMNNDHALNDAINLLIKHNKHCLKEEPQGTRYYQYTAIVASYLTQLLQLVENDNDFPKSTRDLISDSCKEPVVAKNSGTYTYKFGTIDHETGTVSLYNQPSFKSSIFDAQPFFDHVYEEDLEEAAVQAQRMNNKQ
jgi:hypothetical protein